jgi:hypothetical protein
VRFSTSANASGALGEFAAATFSPRVDEKPKRLMEPWPADLQMTNAQAGKWNTVLVWMDPLIPQQELSRND